MKFTRHLSSILFSALAIACSRAATQPVSIEFGGTGLTRIVWNGRDYLAEDLRADGRIGVEYARTPGEEDQPRDILGKRLGYKVDEASKTVTVDYDGARLSCRYATEGNRLDMFVELTNKAAEPMVDFKLNLGELVLLRDYKNASGDPTVGSLGVNNLIRMGFRVLLAEGAVIALGNWEVASPVGVNVDPPTPEGNQAVVLLSPRKVQGSHPVVDAKFFEQPGRPIAPGMTDRYHVSLSLSEPGTKDESLCPELLAHIRKERPMVVKWPDRRAIGMLALANPATGWATNPRGYLMGQGQNNDVTTEEGILEFGEGVMDYADRSVGILKDMDAQGAIVWDLEGAQFPHAVTYIGDPRKIAGVSPEMDRYADAFFKKFTDAGLRVGVTIRPTEIYEMPGQPGKWTHREVKDPVQLMSDKIAYAQKRWGCTIFYLDSNVFNEDWLAMEQKGQMKEVPYLLPVAMIQELQKRHPDVLIIPEWADARYYSCSVPYASVNLRQLGTPQAIRNIYPEAFMLVSTNRYLLEQSWETYSNGVLGGDVLLFLAWHHDPANGLVKLIYEEADFRKKGMPAQLKNAKYDVLAAAATGGDPLLQYYAAEALGGNSDPRTLETLAGLLDASNLLVRKNAIIALGRSKQAASPELVDRMVEILGDPESGMLAPFAADTLGSMGDRAVSAILEMFGGQSPQLVLHAIRAANAMADSNVQINEKLMEQLDSSDLTIREQAIRTLGKKKVKEAFPKLLAALQDKDEQISGTAVRALGDIGDQKAIESIVQLYDRGYHTVVVYWIREAQDTALKQITGEKNSRSTRGWQAWPAEL